VSDLKYNIGDHVNYIVYNSDLKEYVNVNGVIVNIIFDADARQFAHSIKEYDTDKITNMIWSAGINFSLSKMNELDFI